MRIALSAGGRYSGVTLYLPHAARHRHRRIRYPVSGIRSLASGLWHPASIHRASRPHGLFHNFCWQACGHPEHPPSNTLIRRHFPETVRNAASRLKSVRRAPHGRRPPPNRPAASRGDNPLQRIFDAAVFHSFCAQTCGYLAPPRAKRLIHRNFSQSSCLRRDGSPKRQRCDPAHAPRGRAPIRAHAGTVAHARAGVARRAAVNPDSRATDTSRCRAPRASCRGSSITASDRVRRAGPARGRRSSRPSRRSRSGGSYRRGA